MWCMETQPSNYSFIFFVAIERRETMKYYYKKRKINGVACSYAPGNLKKGMQLQFDIKGRRKPIIFELDPDFVAYLAPHFAKFAKPIAKKGGK